MDYDKDKEDYVRKDEPLHVIVTKNQYTNYWMAIKDPNDESKILGIMGL